MLTSKAIERLTKDSKTDPTLFTDGTHHSTFEPPIQGSEKTQEKTAQKEEETQTQQHLQLIQQYNNQLRQQLNKLILLSQNM